MSHKIKILQKVKRLLHATFEERIQDTILFGSQAKNSENMDSDFDILIITKDIFNWKEKSLIRDICFDVSLDFEVLIDSKIISQEEIDNKFWGKHPLISDALKFGIYA